MGKLLAWLERWLGRNPYADEHEKAMRRSWTLAATELNLVYSTGTTPSDDEITGRLDGFCIAIFNEFSFDVQKLVTVIRVCSEGVLHASQDLDRTGLLAAYDASMKDYGVVREGLLSDEARAWFLGHRCGIGTEVVEGNLVYRQHYGMDNAADIALVVRAMALTIRQLAYRSPK